MLIQVFCIVGCVQSSSFTLFFVLNVAIQHLDQLQDVFLVCDLCVVGNSVYVAQQEAVYTLNSSSSGMGLGCPLSEENQRTCPFIP
jgi:hypothetical protein